MTTSPHGNTLVLAVVSDIAFSVHKRIGTQLNPAPGVPPTGKIIAAGSADGMVRLFDMGGRSPIMGWPSHTLASTCSICFGPDQNSIFRCGAGEETRRNSAPSHASPAVSRLMGLRAFRDGLNTDT